MKMCFFAMLVVVIIWAFTNAPVRGAESSPQPAPVAQPYVDDDWLSLKIQAGLMFHAGVSSFADVKVQDGVVTLTGTVRSEARREQTANYVRTVRGVRGVINKLTVVTPPSRAAVPLYRVCRTVVLSNIRASRRQATLFC